MDQEDQEALRSIRKKMIGKKIVGVEFFDHVGEEDADKVLITLSDGSVVNMKSADSSGYQSWIEMEVN